MQSASLLQFAYAAKEEYVSFGLQLSQQTTMKMTQINVSENDTDWV